MKTILAMLFSTATLCAAAQDTSVIKMEYFIDTDPGVGKAASMSIPASADVTFPFTVNLTGYAIGFHKLYIRTRDNLGRWSLTARRNIEVLASQTQNNVVSGEYFIDQDPGFGAGSANQRFHSRYNGSSKLYCRPYRFDRRISQIVWQV